MHDGKDPVEMMGDQLPRSCHRTRIRPGSAPLCIRPAAWTGERGLMADTRTCIRGGHAGR